MNPDIEIPKHYRPTFQDNLEHAVQYKGAKFRPYFQVGSAGGEGHAMIDVIGEMDAEEVTERFGDTPNFQPERWRRWVFPRTFDTGTLIEDADTLKSLVDPTSDIVMSHAKALRRKEDVNVAIPSFFGPVYQGKDVGEAMGNPIAFPAANVIAVTVGSAGGATPVNMNVAKIQAAVKLAMDNEVDQMEEGTPIVGITPSQWSALFDEQKMIHGDYINGRPLMEGDLPGIFKCDFVISTKFQTDANSYRRCPFWYRRGMRMKDWKAVQVNLAPNVGKRFKIQTYAEFMAGAARAVDELVYEIKCNEA